MRDRDWLIPSIGLTFASGLFGILLIPDTSGIMPAVAMLPAWMMVAALLAAFHAFFSMMRAGIESPISYASKFLCEEWRTVAMWTFYVFLAGLNMTTFMWVKPLLNYLVPFWADPLLADLDKVMFFGHDPWTLLTWLNSRGTALFYHRGWFALMIITLLVVLAQPPSPRKSAVLLTYFFLWSIVGPIVHALLPAGGPIFFEPLGYGDRFAHLIAVPETQELATYLWDTYAGEGFGPGSGISAMPSLHLATITWMVIAVFVFARRWVVPMAACGLMIFLLSISLGWHYAVDGIIGGAAALLCYRLFLAFYSDRLRIHRPASATG